jgi:hypothetical protein
MNSSVIHEGKNMHATLSFVYPDDEQKLKDALNGEKYRNALEEIHEHIKAMYNDNNSPDFVIVSISTIIKIAFEEVL